MLKCSLLPEVLSATPKLRRCDCNRLTTNARFPVDCILLNEDDRSDSACAVVTNDAANNKHIFIDAMLTQGGPSSLITARDSLLGTPELDVSVQIPNIQSDDRWYKISGTLVVFRCPCWSSTHLNKDI